MSLPCTQFNPFGSQHKPLKALKMKIERISKKFEEDSLESQAVKAEATSFAKILEGLTEVLSEIQVPSIQPMISEIAIPLAKVIGHFGGINREEFNSAEFNNMFRRMSRFIQNVADLVAEPLNSEILGYWGVVFKALLTAKHNSFRENGALLWKKTFGTIKTPLKWPGDLRETLEKLPKRLGIHLPPVAKAFRHVPISFTDDQAMDGLQTTSDVASAALKEDSDRVKDTSESQVSFQLSQQSAFNVVADKLLKERNVKSELASSPKVTAKQTPTRKRTGRISMLDEDSCDYVPITATPPSSRRNRLTDRQKDTITKAAGPRTSINYVDEESQSGLQKAEKMKNAFKALNFDIGEESLSALSENVEKKPSQETKQGEKPVKRALFDSPVKALPVVSSNAASASNVSEKEIESASATEDLAMASPPEKRQKIDDLEDLDVGHSKPEEQLEKLPIIIEEDTSVKRLSIEDCVTETKNQVESEVPKESESPSLGVVPIDGTDSSKVAESPPKTPRTPSILRSAKRLGGADSPLTERKKNRVHFGEDSLPKVSSSSPMTPRRKVETKSPFKPPPSTIMNLDMKQNDLMDIALEADSKTTPFFPALVHCQDPIEKILFPLASMCTQKSRDYCKKQLQLDHVTTIGDFASLPKSQIDKYSWIKSRTTGAYNVLAQYEKRVAEGVVQETIEKTPTEKPEAVQHTPILVTEVLSEKEIVSTQSNNTPTEEEESNIPPNSEVSDATSQSTTVVNTQQSLESVHKSASDLAVSSSSSIAIVSTIAENGPVKSPILPVLLSRENSPVESVQNTSDKVKMEGGSEKEPTGEEAFLEDARSLRQTCYSLLNNESHWPTEKSAKLLERINTSSRCLKVLIRDHGDGAWLTNDEDVENVASNIEEDVKKVSDLSKKLYTYKYKSGIPWLSVMTSICESTMYLDTIYSEKK